jgi:hypothetical protein
VTDFEDAVIPPDSTPPLTDAEYPCRVCGREAGPYGGRGPKPKYCPEHKKGTKAAVRSAKVTGAPANLAAQATGVLVQLNGMLAIGAMAMGLNGTASAIAQANPNFEEQAYQALLTDQDLCKLILKGGVKSAKLSLGIAYVGMGTAVIPTAVMELKEKKEERDAKREAEEAISHGGGNGTGT